jgi:uncharacterized protein YukE
VSGQAFAKVQMTVEAPQDFAARCHAASVKYDKDAIAAFSEVFDSAREQVEEIRSSMMKPELTEAEFGESWRDEGTRFVREFERIELDLGDLADVLEHMRDAMIESAEHMSSTDNASSARLDVIRRQVEG